MTKSQLKALFRELIKVVAGGPPVGTPGQNRAAGLLQALDAVADYATPATEPLTLAHAKNPPAGTSIEAATDYAITGPWNGAPARTVVVRGLPLGLFATRGYLLPSVAAGVGGGLEWVNVDVAAGTYAAGVTAAQFGALSDLASDTATQLVEVATTLPLTATRTGNYTLALADAGCLVPVDYTGGNSLAFTFPDDAAVHLPIGSIGYLRRLGGEIDLQAAPGVQLLPPGVHVHLDTYGEASWHKVAPNTFWLKGDLV